MSAKAKVQTQDKEEGPVIYDALAKNRFEYEVKQGEFLFDVAHVFDGELAADDERYMQWLREFNVSGNENEVSEEARESSCRYWDDVIREVENIDYPEDADWKTLIEHQEKIDALNDLLAVAIVDPKEKKAEKRSLGGTVNLVVITQCFFNGEAPKQKHTLTPKSFELEKKYSRIQGKRFRQEKVGGALKTKPKVSYTPQDHKLGELYDEMKISVEGFRGDIIPLRFKTAVMHDVFAPKLDPKK